MKIIDLRSDTVTLPTSEMMDAINSATLGDDVYVEDSSTIELENLAAKITGKEAGLLVSSGTMGNLISLKVFIKEVTSKLDIFSKFSKTGIHSHPIHEILTF